MCNHGAGDRPYRIDVEIARRTIEPGRGRTENGFRLDQSFTSTTREFLRMLIIISNDLSGRAA